MARSLSIALVLVMLVALPGAAAAAPGDLDASFGRDGTAALPVLASPEVIGVAAAGRDVVVGGSADVKPPGDARTGPGDLDFFATRVDALGRLDPSFGVRGTATANFGREDRATTMVVQADGKIVLAGAIRHGTPVRWRLGIARFTADGQLDREFGTDGHVVVDQPTMPFTPVAIHTEQFVGMTLAFRVIPPFGMPQERGYLALAHLMDDGTPAEHFGPSGIREVATTPQMSAPAAIGVDQARGFVLAGQDGTAPGLTRVGFDGTVTQTFGVGGVAPLPILGQPRVLGIRPDGAITVGLSDSPYGQASRLVRVGPGGAIDSGLVNGTFVDEAPARALDTQADGRTIVLRPDYAVRRLLPNGSADPTWRVDQQAERRFGVPWASASAMAVVGELVYVVGHANRIEPADFQIPDWRVGMVRIHAGDDTVAPRLTLHGVPKRCVKHAFIVRVRVREDSPNRDLSVELDGRERRAERFANGQLFKVRVPRRLSAGRHRLRFAAHDGNGNSTVARASFRRCR